MIRGNPKHGAHRRGKGKEAETAERLRDASNDNPDEIHIAVAETDANRAFSDRQQGGTA